MNNNIFENERSSDYVCSECGASVSDTDMVCPKCGADISEIEEDIEEDQIEIKDKDKTKYPALSTISGAYKFLAWFSAFIAVLLALSVLSHIDDDNRIIYAIISLVTGVILCISFLAISEIIRLFIDIEKNTRMFTVNQDTDVKDQEN